MEKLFWFLLFFSACATANRDIPTVEDQKVRFFVEDEGWRIVKITEKATDYQRYKFHLARFQRKGVVGLSAGNHEIYINYELAQQAMTNTNYLWILRKTLAHEVGHDVAGHSPNRQALASAFSGVSTIGRIASAAPGAAGAIASLAALGVAAVGKLTSEFYSRSQEMEADRLGIDYFKKLAWDCRVWTRLFKRQLEVGDTGDFHHPTEERLKQALELCLSPDHPERIATEKWLAERWELEEKKREEERRLERR